MPESWIRPACVALLVAAWGVDLLTPQLFVAAILLNGPIALSSLALDFRFTRLLIVLALIANASAGYVNGLVEHQHWEAVALGNRIVCGFSFLLVGGLSVATQRSAARAGEFGARQDRAARERSVRRAVETIRASVNPELIRRAIVREALASLSVDAARLYVFSPSLDEPATYRSYGDDIDVGNERPEASILSLLHRIAGQREGITVVRETDPLGRLLLDTLGTPHAIAAPLVEHETVFGVLLLSRSSVPFEPHFEEGLAYYVDQSAIALAQASLFVQLAERNDELATANVALRDRGDVIRDLVYALSHDLRTPLSAAGMTMQQALDGAYGPLPATYRDILERTIASNAELQRLSETLLLVSRYESGERSARREPVSLGALARDVTQELEPLWQGKELTVRLTLASDPVVRGDDRELRRALVNLIANAITWTPARRSIEVRVVVSGDRAQIVVDDAGYGVPEAERANLFQRVRETPSRHGAGSGLGLYLVRRIAESHDGFVTYAPSASGGSAFTFSLPLAAVSVPA
jgi:signal transduction histidine kinase